MKKMFPHIHVGLKFCVILQSSYGMYNTVKVRLMRIRQKFPGLVSTVPVNSSKTGKRRERKAFQEEYTDLKRGRHSKTSLLLTFRLCVVSLSSEKRIRLKLPPSSPLYILSDKLKVDLGKKQEKSHQKFAYNKSDLTIVPQCCGSGGDLVLFWTLGQGSGSGFWKKPGQGYRMNFTNIMYC
jgi:hypothetical protein